MHMHTAAYMAAVPVQCLAHVTKVFILYVLYKLCRRSISDNIMHVLDNQCCNVDWWHHPASQISRFDQHPYQLSYTPGMFQVSSP